MGLAVLLLGTSVALAQSDCSPCEPLCNPCEPLCGSGGICNSPFTFNGWIEMGLCGNSNGGGSDNGPMRVDSRSRTDFILSQLYLSFAKEMNTRRGFDWGASADLVYGAHAGGMQTFGDETFDFDWGTNRHGYSMSAYNLYGTLGYKDWSVKVGKFGTPVGWEESAAKNNFFYSHSYCYWIEPATHMGVLGTYDMSKRLSVSAGWVTGMDSSFSNPNDNQGVLTGFTYSLTDNATVYYWFNGGKQFDLGTSTRFDYFVQSLCYEWTPTKRFTYVLQYNLRNDNKIGGGSRYSSYGINNHFLYKLSDQWGAGMRLEWLRENGGFLTDFGGNYYEASWGLNWNPCDNVSVRPEIRYDWYHGAYTPFGNDSRKDQVTGACGVVVSF